MKTQFSSKKIAAAGIGAALSLLAIVGAYYIPNLSLSLNVAAALGLLVPLSQKYYKEAGLAYVAAAGLGAIFVNLHILPFVLVTGLYTIAAVILYDKKVKWYITAPVCFVYGCLCFFILYQLTSLVALDFEKLNLAGLGKTVLYLTFNAVFVLALALYHALILWVNNYMSHVVAKILK